MARVLDVEDLVELAGQLGVAGAADGQGGGHVAGGGGGQLQAGGAWGGPGCGSGWPVASIAWRATSSGVLLIASFLLLSLGQGYYSMMLFPFLMTKTASEAFDRDAETVETGTRSAALGGFTAVHAMANTDPVADTAGVVEQVWRLGREAGWCEVQPIGAVTGGLAGERLAELGAMADSAAAVNMS